MKFLLDQDVYAATLRFLSGLGHDVIPVAQIGLAQATDEDLLKTAHDQNRIFVTRDRDFGNLVFAKGLGAKVRGHPLKGLSREKTPPYSKKI